MQLHFSKKRPNYLTTKEKYINEWKEIQRIENEMGEYKTYL